MARQRIPGLNYVHLDEKDDSEPFRFVGFNLKTYTVPGKYKFGNCRSVSEFHKLRTLAEGKHGTIYKVEEKSRNKYLYALKKLDIPEDQAMPQNFHRQIDVLKRLNHPHIVNLKEVVSGKQLRSTYLLLDLCVYSLIHVIDDVDVVYLQHNQMKNIMSQMLYGLEYIHQMNIIHRDLCPRNVLFTESGVLKISDFGSCRRETEKDMTPGPGLRWYRAPEILFGSTKYTKAIDIWSAGCIFAEMIYQKPLLQGKADGDIVRSLIELLGTPNERTMPGYSNLPVPRHYDLLRQPYNRIRSHFCNQTDATVSFLQCFLQYNPSSRSSAEDLQKHVYFTEYPQKCSDGVLVETLKKSGRI